MYIDLHSHTNHSDGTSSVANSLTAANSLSLSLFSVSDHNTVSAYKEILHKRHLFSGKILPAVELSCMFEKHNIEVLGYGIDVQTMDSLIKETYSDMENLWHIEVTAIIKKLLENGAVLDKEYLKLVEKKDERVKQGFGGARGFLLSRLKDHPENALLFGGKKEFDAMDRHIFYRKWITNPNTPYFFDRSEVIPDIKTIVDIIKKSGGLSFVAHSFIYANEFIDCLDKIAQYVDGFECHYGTFTKEQKDFLFDFCEKRSCFKSGGSDFHGLDMRPKNIMGLSGGEKIEFSLIEPWFDKVKDSLI